MLASVTHMLASVQTAVNAVMCVGSYKPAIEMLDLIDKDARIFVACELALPPPLMTSQRA